LHERSIINVPALAIDLYEKKANVCVSVYVQSKNNEESKTHGNQKVQNDEVIYDNKPTIDRFIFIFKSYHLNCDRNQIDR
jgi:hypothetical protein